MVKIQNGKRYLVNIPSYSDFNDAGAMAGGDVASAGTSSVETGSAPVIDDSLIDLSGSTYVGGPYDTFQAYTSGSDPANRGYGWESAWQIRIPTSNEDFPLIIAVDDFSFYGSGSNPVGTFGGWGWGESLGGN